MSSVEVYLIFWAPPGSEFAPDVANGNERYMNLIERFFTDIGGSPMLNILSQYYDFENSSPRYRPNVLTLADSYVDTRPYPQAPLGMADIEGAITNAIAVNNWPINPNTPPPNDRHLNKLYVVYTPTGVQTCLTDPVGGCSGIDFGGYHNYFEQTPRLKYVYIPTIGPLGYEGSAFPNNRYADPAISTTLHELAEAITDPYGVGWSTRATPFGYLQIGDLCSPQRGRSIGPQGSDGGNVTLNGNRYQVQLLYSEVVRGCTSGFYGQFINFNALGNKTYGDAPFTLSADATSLLPVTFTAAGACTVSNALVTITGAGSCTITASQAGNKPTGGFYDPATPVTRSFSIASATPAFSFNLSTLPPTSYGDPAFSVAGYASKPADATGAITFAMDSGSAGCSVTADGMVTITGATGDAGQCVIEASLAADSNYLAAGPIGQSFAIAQAGSSVSVSCPASAPVYNGSAITGCTATVSGVSGLSQSLTVTYTGRNGTTYGPSTTAPSNAGDYTASASYAESLNHTGSSGSKDFSIARRAASVTPNAISKTEGQADPAPLTTGTVSGFLAGDSVTATYSRAAGETPGAYTISATLSPASALANYDITYNTATFTINARPAANPVWTFQGFHQPIGASNSILQAPNPSSGGVATPPAPTTNTIWNTAKGGSRIPLKFNVFVNGVERTSTGPDTIKSFSATKLSSCAASGAADPIEELASAGATSLRYDGVAGQGGQYIQKWKTPTVSSATCYRIALTTADNSVLYTFVKLRK